MEQQEGKLSFEKRNIEIFEKIVHNKQEGTRDPSNEQKFCLIVNEFKHVSSKLLHSLTTKG